MCSFPVTHDPPQGLPGICIHGLEYLSAQCHNFFSSEITIVLLSYNHYIFFLIIKVIMFINEKLGSPEKFNKEIKVLKAYAQMNIICISFDTLWFYTHTHKCKFAHTFTYKENRFFRLKCVPQNSYFEAQCSMWLYLETRPLNRDTHTWKRPCKGWTRRWPSANPREQPQDKPD